MESEKAVEEKWLQEDILEECPSQTGKKTFSPLLQWGVQKGLAAWQASVQDLLLFLSAHQFPQWGAAWSMALWHPRTEKTLGWCCDLRLVWLGQCQKRGRRKGKTKNDPEIVRLWQFQCTKSFNLPSWASPLISYFPSEICCLISLSCILSSSIPSSKLNLYLVPWSGVPFNKPPLHFSEP